MVSNRYISISIAILAVLGIWLMYSSRNVAPDLAPFYPTPMVVVDKMLEMAEISKSDVVYDLGSGDGRIVIAAADEFGVRGVGVEYDPGVAQLAIDNVRQMGLEELVEIVIGDAMQVDVSPATVVTLYLLPESNLKLKPILEESLSPGSRVVSHDWDMEGWTAKRIERVSDGVGRVHTLYLWVIGEQYRD